MARSPAWRLKLAGVVNWRVGDVIRCSAAVSGFRLKLYIVCNKNDSALAESIWNGSNCSAFFCSTLSKSIWYSKFSTSLLRPHGFFHCYSYGTDENVQDVWEPTPTVWEIMECAHHTLSRGLSSERVQWLWWWRRNQSLKWWFTWTTWRSCQPKRICWTTVAVRGARDLKKFHKRWIRDARKEDIKKSGCGSSRRTKRDVKYWLTNKIVVCVIGGFRRGCHYV